MVNLWFITICECLCVGGVTSLFLQTAMLYECNLILRYAPSSIPFRHALYLLSIGSFHKFVSPIFVTEGGPILILLQLSVAQLLNMAEGCAVPGSTVLVAVKPQERHFTLSSRVGFCLKDVAHYMGIAKLSKSSLGFILAHAVLTGFCFAGLCKKLYSL